jgi:glycosyltransferase involved in cell wall biosynthesis
MKVLMVVHSYYPYDPRVRREAEALRDRGDSVDVVCLRDKGESPVESVNGVNVYRLPVNRHRGSGLVTYLAEYILFFILALLKVTALFASRRYEIIQVHTIPDWLVFCAIVPRIFGAKVILDMHEVMPEFFSYRYNLSSGHPVILMIRLSEKLATAFADKVITVSDTIKDILVARGVSPDKITIVMNSADDKLFRPAAKSVISHQFTLSEANVQSVMMLSYHGLLSDIYDLGVVFRALVRLKPQVPCIKFLVIGSGPQETEYKDTASRLGIGDMVSFLGHQPPERVVEILAGVDIGVVPLKGVEFTHLAFPTKLVEYVALGIPAITAERRTVMQYFNNGALAFYKPDDESSLAGAILKLHRNPEGRAGLAKQAQECYSRISWAVMKERYYKLIRN